MDLNTASKLPEWLTPERIREYKEDLAKAVPYTEKEVIIYLLIQSIMMLIEWTLMMQREF